MYSVVQNRIPYTLASKQFRTKPFSLFRKKSGPLMGKYSKLGFVSIAAWWCQLRDDRVYALQYGVVAQKTHFKPFAW